jgi:hypothetical protein
MNNNLTDASVRAELPFRLWVCFPSRNKTYYPRPKDLEKHGSEVTRRLMMQRLLKDGWTRACFYGRDGQPISDPITPATYHP